MTNIVTVNCVGDSWTYSYLSWYFKALGIDGQARGGDDTTPRYWERFYPSAGVIAANYSLAGWRLTDLVTQASIVKATVTQPTSRYSNRPRKNILCVLIGTNVSDLNPTTFSASVGAYCLDMADTFDAVILGTIGPRGDGTQGANFDTEYKTPYNDAITDPAFKTTWGISRIADNRAVAQVSANGAYDAVGWETYWDADKVHLTLTSGQTLWSQVWATEINAEIAVQQAA